MAVTNIFESNVPLQGERATGVAHRKIELQSPADLTYLIVNVTKAAREKVDRHLPPDAAPLGEDAMRKRVEQLVDDYIRNTFNSAKDNISVNGMDSKEMEAELEKAQEGEEIEPFDTKLAQRIQTLSGQIEKHTLDLANLRRNAPAQTLQRFQQSFTKASEQDDARLQQYGSERLDEAKQTEIDIGEIERLDEVQATWQNGSENLISLKSELGGTVAKMERAQQAVDFVENK
ncbi:hypothetical protein LTR37_014658 [Vermiconidia calcicola]|uniref:Uncharacterized protein n=1 Tax=Vermiconidia calcicola TaxID=1690605 RepID=A0ACC3MSV7_9PEZI|nr:hypothetical protein LTR37_014658 [Vermiconidia calcicola]